jgi:hypothetical protein
MSKVKEITCSSMLKFCNWVRHTKSFFYKNFITQYLIGRWFIHTFLLILSNNSNIYYDSLKLLDIKLLLTINNCLFFFNEINQQIIQYFSFNEIFSWTLSAIIHHHWQKDLFQKNKK